MTQSMSFNGWTWANVIMRTTRAHFCFLPAICSADEQPPLRVINEEGTGLIVVLHGYKQHYPSLLKQIHVPSSFHSLYVPLLNYHGGSDINLLCMEGNEEVISTIREWCEQHPMEPIFVIGISLGGRLAIGLQHALRYVAEHNHIHTITLGSPLGGTSLMFPGTLPFWKFFLGEAVAAELNPDPSSAQQVLIANMMVNKPMNRTFCHFYSTTDHLCFPPSRCVLPDQSVFCLSNCAHREMLTHPDVVQYIHTFLFPP